MSGRDAIRTVWFLVCAIWACGAAHVHAAEPVLLRASLARPGPALVGERITITVELLTATMFASAPVFELPTIPGALLMKIEDRPVLGTEEIDDASYTVQRHELALFIMRPGVEQVPPFTVRFASPLRFGEPSVEHRLTTPALYAEARMPPGAEHLPSLIATRVLNVQQTWQPQPGKARVGDGFTRTVTLTAPDVPGMAFPPLPLARVDGLAVYPKPPVVQDQVERGDFTGKRLDMVTYLCERPGQFTLPALIIPWWDLKEQKLKQVMLPAVTLEVAPGPTQSADPATLAAAVPNRQWLWWTTGAALLLGIAMVALWCQRAALRAAWEYRQAQYLASEAGCFARLCDACRAGEARVAYPALLRWLDSTHHGPNAATIAAFLSRHPDPNLRRQVEVFQEAFLGRATPWHGAALVNALRQARRQRLERRTIAAAPLPALNPR